MGDPESHHADGRMLCRRLHSPYVKPAGLLLYDTRTGVHPEGTALEDRDMDPDPSLSDGRRFHRRHFHRDHAVLLSVDRHITRTHMGDFSL